MLRTLITASLLFGSLYAQAPPSKVPLRPYQPAFTELKAALGLSDEQIEKLKQIQQSRYQLTTQLYDQIGQKQKALNDMLNSGSTDALAIGKAEIELQQLRKQTQVDKTSTYHDQALAVLTPEQKTKLATLE